MKLFFYAINSVGLGHAARLSVLQKLVERRTGAECRFFSNSLHVDALFGCPGFVVKDDTLAGPAQRSRRILDGLSRALETFQPDVMVCDTYWPRAIVAELRRNAVRTVLVMRMMHVRIMGAQVVEALEAFDTVLIPHHPEELLWTYRKNPRLLSQIASLPVGIVGPIARRAAVPPLRREVIFTVGGGGEWPGASHANRIETFLSVFSETSALLMRHGHPKPSLAVGPLLKLDGRFQGRFNLIQTTSLHERFGPNTVIVSRGGYNICWEAIAAGSQLALCGSHQAEEDIDARCSFLEHEGLGRKVRLSARALLEAIVRPRTPRESLAAANWSRIVNGGLTVAIDEVLGGSFLRVREPDQARRPVMGSAASDDGQRGSRPPRERGVRRASLDPLVARFEAVDPARPSAALMSLAACARETGYRTQFRQLSRDPSATDPAPAPRADPYVDILAWPGPRLRSELRIWNDLQALRDRRLSTGLRLHADRVPPFLSQYCLRLFSVCNGRASRPDRRGRTAAARRNHDE